MADLPRLPKFGETLMDRLETNPRAPIDAASVSWIDDEGNAYDDFGQKLWSGTAQHTSVPHNRAGPGQPIPDYNEWTLQHRGTMAPWGVYENPQGETASGFAWPAMITEPIEAGKRFFAPGGGFENNPNPESEKDALTLLMSLYGGNALSGTFKGAASAKMANALSNDVGVFAGQKAATADHNALAFAQKLASEGADRNTIWDKTGWFQGPDQKWRFEIDDSRSFLKGGDLPASETAARWGNNVAKAMYHPELVKAYPDLENTSFGGHPGRGGYYERGLLEDGKLSVGDDYRGAERNSVALHEIQHVLQDLEGHAMGAGSNAFTQQADAKLARDALSWRREMERYKDASPDLSYRDNAVVEDYYRMGAPDWIPSRDARDIAMDYGGNPNDQLEAVRNLYGLDRRTTPYTPKEMYKRTAGEVEARNVQTRMNMTPEQRRATPPWETQDIPYEDQIVRLLSDTGKPNALGSALASLDMSPEARLARAREMGFDLPAYHATSAEFDAFNTGFRKASFFNDNPDKALAGARGTPDRILPVMLRSDYIKGLSLTPTEKQWWEGLPETTSDEAFIEGLRYPSHNLTKWWQVFDEAQNPDGSFTYTKKKMPRKTIDDVRSSGEDVYGSKYLGTWEGEEGAARIARESGMDGFILSDEGGVSIGIVDPTKIRSVNAAFDPARVGENGLLLSDTGKPSIMGASLSSMSEPKNALAAGAVKAGEEHLPYTIEPRTADGLGYNVVDKNGKWPGEFVYEELPNAVMVRHASLIPEYQRKGIASQVYGKIQDTTGKPLTPDAELTDAGYEFWKAHYPEAVRNHIRGKNNWVEGDRTETIRRLRRDGVPDWRLAGGPNRPDDVLWSDTGKPSLLGSALAGAQDRSLLGDSWMTPKERMMFQRQRDDFYHAAQPGFTEFHDPTDYLGVHLTASKDLRDSYHAERNGPLVSVPSMAFDTPFIMPPEGHPRYNDVLKQAQEILPGFDGTKNSLEQNAVAYRDALRANGFDSIMSMDDKLLDDAYEAISLDPKALNFWTERLYSDTGKPSLLGSALAGAQEGKWSQQAIADRMRQKMVNKSEKITKDSHNKPTEVFSGYRGVADPRYHGPHPQSKANAYWMTDDPNIASSYALEFPEERPAVLRTEARFENPLTIDADGASWQNIPHNGDEYYANELAVMARDMGHDGLILRNVIDPSNGGVSGSDMSNVAAALTHGTVHSPLSREILYSDNRPSLLGSALAGAQGERPWWDR